MNNFKIEDVRDRKRSGTGGQLSFLDALLCGTVEAIDSIEETETKEKEESSK